MELKEMTEIYDKILENYSKDMKRKYKKTKNFDKTFGEKFKSISKNFLLNFISCKVLLDTIYQYRNENQKFAFFYDRLYEIVEKYNEISMIIIEMQNNFKKFNT